VTSANPPPHKTRGVGSDIYGARRLALAKLVKPAFEHTGIAWFLDAGTLLGAYRDGVQIPHDDDFDTAVYLPEFGAGDLIALRSQVAETLPDPYQVRIVTSYAQKLEIFDPASDNFELPPQYLGADFHTVTVDIQIMTDASDGAVYLHDMLEHVRVPQNAIIPTREITLEGHQFPCPHDIVRFLEPHYGYLGADAVYDSKSRKYAKDR
jgi:hypothetical protein